VRVSESSSPAVATRSLSGYLWLCVDSMQRAASHILFTGMRWVMRVRLRIKRRNALRIILRGYRQYRYRKRRYARCVVWWRKSMYLRCAYRL
jgi:hypothetical protein